MGKTENASTSEIVVGWFSVAHVALALISAALLYFARQVVDLGGLMQGLEHDHTAMKERMDRQIMDLNDHIQRLTDRQHIEHDQIDSRRLRTEDRLQQQIVELQKRIDDARDRALEVCTQVERAVLKENGKK